MSKICFEDTIDDKFNVIICISSDSYDTLNVNDAIYDFIEDLRGYFSE